MAVFAWPTALVFWVVFVWAFVPEFRIVAKQHEPSTTAQDANSKRFIAVGQGVAMIAAFVIASAVPAETLAHRELLFWIGLSVLICGSLLRRHCWKMLGESFTGLVIVKPEQAVVERGAYRYVRHPSYTAGAMMLVGIGLSLANWISLIVLCLGTALAYGYRVAVEERALAEVIGDPYRRYMSRTKRFVPFLF